MPDDDEYDVLPLPVHLGGIINRQKDEIKPFVAIYFPAEILEKMNWHEKTPLNLAIEGDALVIRKKELEYEIEIEAEPFDD